MPKSLREIAAAAEEAKRRKLLVETILDGLKGDDRVFLEEMLRDRAGYSHGAVVRVLRAAGTKCSEHAVRSWRDQNGVTK